MLTQQQKDKLRQAGYSDTQIRGYEMKKFGSSSMSSDQGGYSWADTKEDIFQAGREIKESAFERGQQIQESTDAYARGEQGLARTFFERMGLGTKFATEAIGSIFKGGVKAALTEKGEENVKAGVGKTLDVMGKFGDAITPDAVTDWGADMFIAYNNLPPEEKRKVDAIIGPVSLGFDVVGAGASKQAVTKGFGVAKKGVNTITGILKKSTNYIDDLKKFTPNILRKAGFGQTDDAVKLAVAFEKSFLDSPATYKALEKIGPRNVKPQQLIDDLAKEGYLPNTSKGFADFDSGIDDIYNRLGRLSDNLDPVLENVPTLTRVDDFVENMKQIAKESPEFITDYNNTIRKIEKMGESISNKYGDTLTAKQINNILRESNGKTKAFNKKQFEIDAEEVKGQAARSIIEQVTPDGVGTQVNQEMGRLIQLRKTMNALHTKNINVGPIQSALGRYIGATLIGSAGVATGSGALVIAGLAAALGGQYVIKLLKQLRFSPAKYKSLLSAIKSDEKLVKELISQTKGAEKAQLKRLLLPEGSTRKNLNKVKKNLKNQ